MGFGLQLWMGPLRALEQERKGLSGSRLDQAQTLTFILYCSCGYTEWRYGDCVHTLLMTKLSLVQSTKHF
jgi:hypothetical protein